MRLSRRFLAVSSTLRSTVSLASLATLCLAPAAFADDTRFAVVDLTAPANHEKLVLAVEQDVERLRPDSRPIEDLSMRRLLMTGEGPAAAAARLLQEAQERRTSGDCVAAVELAQQSELITLSSVPLDDERDVLRDIYTLLVLCEDQRGRATERTVAAQRLRALVGIAPDGMSAEFWGKFVERATGGPATMEIQVDSEPANAQIAIDFHGVGVTPRTMHIAPGLHYVEVQKEGFRKAFRQVTVGTQPFRTVFRLVERTHDRLDQARAALTTLRKIDPVGKPLALARLAQYARADTLVTLTVTDNRVRIVFFDAERGAVAGDALESPFDPITGRVEALASRATPGVAGARTPGHPASGAGATASQPDTAARAPGPGQKAAADALPEAQSHQQLTQFRRRVKPPTPWWSWAIAGTLAASVLTFIYLDQPRTKDTLGIQAHWDPPSR